MDPKSVGKAPTKKKTSKQMTKHSSRGEQMEVDDEQSHVSDYGQRQMQHQHQLQRSMEASKQMLFGTFGNVIAILEEYEKREMAKTGKGRGKGKRLPTSTIPIPDQRHKDNDDVESIVKTQLLLFETQTKACPPEVLEELKDELKRRTISWAAVREEIGVEGMHKTDTYVTKLYEILARGSTKHDIPDCRGVSKKVMRDSFSKILKGDHDRKMIDEAFKSDPRRQAVAPETRHSEMYYEGAQRITRAYGNNALAEDLQRSVRKHQTDWK